MPRDPDRSNLRKLSLETVGKLDQGGALAFEKLLSRAAADCIDRPADNTARKVTLEFELEPVLDDDMTCTEVKCRIQATAKLPSYKTKVRSLGVRPGGGGMFVFNEDSPDNVRQGTLLEDDDES